MNYIILVGRLTQNPTKSSTIKGMDYCRFTIAVDRYISNDEKKADFINCTCFGKTAENILKYVSKGNLIAVNGKLQTNTYYDDRSRKNITTTNVIVDTVQFLERKKSQENSYSSDLPTQKINENTTGYQTLKQEEFEINDDDLPF